MKIKTVSSNPFLPELPEYCACDNSGFGQSKEWYEIRCQYSKQQNITQLSS